MVLKNLVFATVVVALWFCWCCIVHTVCVVG